MDTPPAPIAHALDDTQEIPVVGAGPVRARPSEVFLAAWAFLLPVAYFPRDYSLSFAPKDALLLLVGVVGLPALVRLAWRSPLAWAARTLLGFLAVALVSALVSADRLVGLFGLYGWGTGWLFWLGAAGAFALGARCSSLARTRVRRALLAGIVLNAAVALLQSASVLPASLNLGLYRGTADGLMGNPVYLEALLLGGLGLLLAGALERRPFALAGVAVLAAALEVSGERLTLLVLAALIIGAVVRRRFAGLGFALPAIAGYASGYVLRAGVAKRLAGTSQATYSLRLHIWETALHALAARPFLGWGPGQTRDAVNAAGSLSLARLVTPLGVVTDAHDFFAEVAVTTGLLGACALVAFLVLAARRARGPLGAFAVLVGIVALVEPLNVGTTPLLFLALGLAAPLAPSAAPSRAAAAAWAPAILAAALAGGALIAGDVALEAGFNAHSLPQARQAARLLPVWPAPLTAEAQDLALASIDAHRRSALVASVAEAQAAARRDPTDPALLVTAAHGEQQLGQTGRAAAELRRALRLAPDDASALAALGILEADSGRPAAARTLLRRSLAVQANGTVRSELSAVVRTTAR